MVALLLRRLNNHFRVCIRDCGALSTHHVAFLYFTLFLANGQCALIDMRDLLFVLLVGKVGFAVADSLTPLKLVQVGFQRDTLALLVTLSFPFEFVFAIWASRITAASSGAPLEPVESRYQMYSVGLITFLSSGFVDTNCGYSSPQLVHFWCVSFLLVDPQV